MMSGAPPFLWAAQLLVVADMHAQARVVIIVTRLKKCVQICHSISFYVLAIMILSPGRTATR